MIEQDLGRIAAALERIAAALERPPEPAEVEADTPAPRKRGRPPKTQAEPTLPQEVESPADTRAAGESGATPGPAAASPSESGSEPPKAVTRDDCQHAAVLLAKTQGPEALQAIYAPYGVTSGRDLKPENYGPVFRAITEALGGAHG